MKRMISLLLALLLVAGLVPAALAASQEAEQAAQELYARGLFLGVGPGEDGKPLFELDRAMTRSEAVTMLVRLLGKETEAAAGGWSLPFEDVPAWARNAVGYAYANGLTNGLSDTRFGGYGTVDAAQYTAFVLRALGYASGVDFHWADTRAFASGLGLPVPAEGVFTRADAVLLSRAALSLPLKGRSVTLGESLSGAAVEPPMLTTAELRGTWQATGADGSLREWRFEGDSFTALSVSPLGQNLPNASLRGRLGVTALRKGSFSLSDGSLVLRCDRYECSGDLLYRTLTQGVSESLSISMPERGVLLLNDGQREPLRFLRAEDSGRIAQAEQQYASLTDEYILSQLAGFWSLSSSYTRPDGSSYQVQNEVFVNGSSYELAVGDSTGYYYYERGSFRVDGSGVYPTSPADSFGVWRGQVSTRRSGAEGERPEGFGAAIFLAYGYTHSESSTGLIARVLEERERLKDPEYAAEQALSRDYSDLLAADLAALRAGRSGAAVESACYVAYRDRNNDLVVATGIQYSLAGTGFYAERLHNLTQNSAVDDPVYHYRALAGQTYGEGKMLYLDLANDVQAHLGAAMLGKEGAFFYAEQLPG